MDFEKQLQELIQAALEAGVKREAIAEALEDAATDFAEGEDDEDKVIADRLPTLQEAAAACEVLNRCNGYDLTVWTDDIWPSDELTDALRAIRKAAAKEGKQ